VYQSLYWLYDGSLLCGFNVAIKGLTVHDICFGLHPQFSFTADIMRLANVNTCYLRQPGGSYVIVLSVILSFCKQDNWRTRKQTSTKLGRHGHGFTLSAWLTSVVIRIRVWIPDQSFTSSSPLRNRGFLDICLYFSYNQRPICTILGEMIYANKIMHPQHFGTDPDPDLD